jgi:hypothetical protein
VTFSPDGQWLSSGGDDGHVCVWEPLTGQEVHRVHGHQNSVCKVAFASDGRTLLTGGRDCTGILWTLRPPRTSKDRSIDELWTSLIAEPQLAYRAIWELAESPKAVVPFLQQRLRPVPSVPEATIRALLTDLDSDSFQRREAATKCLKEFGRGAESVLREALKFNPSAEQKRRIEALLAPLSGMSYEHPPDELRQLRAVAALERIGTRDARELLENLGKGHASAPLTQQAKAALGRLSKHGTISP